MAMRERVRPKAPSLANWLDRAVAYVSPVAGARRMSARASLHAAEAARERFARIEGAEKSDTRGGKWLISRLSPDSQLELDLQTVRDRSRDLYQNDAIGGVVDSKVITSSARDTRRKLVCANRPKFRQPSSIV